MDIINMSLVSALVLFGLTALVLLLLPRRKITTRLFAPQVLFVESLESRVVPASTLHWKMNPVTSNLLNPANWDEGLKPTSNDTLEFGFSKGIPVLSSSDSLVVAGIILDPVFNKQLFILGQLQVGSNAVAGSSQLSGGGILINAGGSLTLVNETFQWSQGDITKGPQGKGNFIISNDAKVVVTGKAGLLQAQTTVRGALGHDGVFQLADADRDLVLDSIFTVKDHGELVVANARDLRGGIVGGAIVLDGGEIWSGPGFVGDATAHPIPLSSLYATSGILDDRFLNLKFSLFYFGGNALANAWPDGSLKATTFNFKDSSNLAVNSVALGALAGLPSVLQGDVNWTSSGILDLQDPFDYLYVQGKFQMSSGTLREGVNSLWPLPGGAGPLAARIDADNDIILNANDGKIKVFVIPDQVLNGILFPFLHSLHGTVTGDLDRRTLNVGKGIVSFIPNKPVGADRYDLKITNRGIASAPNINSIAPGLVSTAGGTVVAVTGSNFTGATQVDFGGVAASGFTINSDTSITVNAPPHSAGTFDVIVTDPEGTSSPSAGDRLTYIAAAAPSISSLGTSSGTTAGGSIVTVNGTNLTGAGLVFFGSVPSSNFIVNSASQITAVAPPQASGTVDVTVVTPSGTSPVSSSDHFTYSNATSPSVTGLSLTSGTTAGGAVTTISGSYFTGATGVSFGSVPADDFTVLSDGSIVATAPPEAAATVDVTVTTYSGTSATSGSDHFTYSNASLPTVSALSVSSGPATGGSPVVITGSYFTGATTVNFGSVTTTDFAVLSDSSILVTAPAQAAGAVSVTVTSYAGTSSTSGSFTYNAVSAPAVTSLSASSGSTAGSTLIEISGSGFTNAQEVDFGSAPVFDFTVNSDSQITVLSPASYAGTIDVQVTTPAGTSAPVAGDRFTYSAASAPAVSSLGTSSGSTTGGTSVAITGTDLAAALDVFFGNVPASGFFINSPTSLTAIAPPNTAGTVDVTVQTPTGSSVVSSSDHFTYSAAAAPSVTSLAATGGSTAGGTLVGINGSGFTSATAVNFGSVPASSFQVVSDTLIAAVAPPQAAGTIDVTVTTPSGTSATGSSDHFAYSSATTPSVTGLSPATGSTAGGDTIVVLGSHFTGATAVHFGTLAASSFTVNADDSLTAVAPPAAATVDVTVTTYAGTSAIGSADHYIYTNVTGAAPSVTAVSPNTDSTAGGQVVTLTGSGFTGATAVKFNTTAASAFTIISDTTLTATAPAGSAATVDITVVTNNGTSATGSADHFTYLSTAAPSITSLSPSSGNSAGGSSVSITGSNFTSASAVTFGGVAASGFTVNSATSISATSPPLPAGSYGVTVTTPSGTSASSTFTVSAASLPTLSSLGTSSGTTAGGTNVALTGTNFTGAIGVYFGGVAASSFTVSSATSISATSPPQFAGTYDVTVVTYAGTSALSSGDRFAYSTATVSSVSSLGTTTGSTAGGTSVTVNGSNFTGATAVMFGLVPAASFTIVSDSQITAVSPPQAAGTLDVLVTTYSGTSVASSSDQFTYTSASTPSVTSLGTSSGSTAGGVTVTINGSHFTGATAVTFGAVPASFTIVSDSQISAVSPAQAAATVDVTVSTFAGTSGTGSADHFTYSAASTPSVSAVSPGSGSAAGGDTITVSGSAFTGATAVSFGSTAAAFTVLNDTTLLATAPPGTAGTVDVTVTTFAGTSGTGSADHYTYNAVTAPSITSLSPSTAGSGGGTAITLSGSGFTSADGVFFGGLPAASYTIVSDSSIVAIAPPQTAGTSDITVTYAGTTSALSSYDRFTVSAASAPAVSSLGTSSGSTAGATTITVSGSGFTGAQSVTFGGVPAAGFVISSDTSLTAVSPSQAAGTVDVVISGPTGTSAVSSSDQFTYNAASAPSVTGLSVTTGSTAGGLGVTVTGSYFTGATAVKFGTVAAAFTVLGDGTLVATAPPQAAGTIDITVTTPSGTSGTGSSDHFTYTAASSPSVSSVTPSSGTVLGGETITVFGSGFTAATAVNFGATAATAFTVLSDNALTATAPAGSAGTVDITVVTPSGTSSTVSADHYTYGSAPSAPSVSSLGTTSGGSGGGSVVIVTGSGFTNATGVSFGSYPAASFFVNSDTQLTAVAPAQAAATVDLTVTTPSGTSPTSSSDHFTYSAASAPSVSAVAATSGPTAGAANITISGANFTGASAVSFGGTAAAGFTVVADGTIFAVAPAGSAGTVDVTVTTPSGTSGTSSSDHYTYVTAPTVTGISPSAGPLAGGMSITLTGTNFSGATVVYVGGVAVSSFTMVSSTSITTTTPAESAGTVDVIVVTAGGPSAASSSDHFTYVAAPTVTGVSPSAGPTAGGTTVTITGTNLSNATAVSFGGTAATSFTLVSSTTITAVSPGGSAGGVNVTVTTAGGTSATSGSDVFTYVTAPTVSVVGPSSGSTAGGTAVTLGGSNLSGATAVYFGTVAATSFTVISSTSISVVAPAHAVGTIDVTVVTAGGTSATSSVDHFTYVAPPAVTGLSVSSGSTSGGTSVTLSGSGFTGATAVYFGGTAAWSFVVNSDGSITAYSPSHVAGTVNVTVVTAYGTSATSSADDFTFM